MGNPYFRFKQFTVWHDRCAMKVGTDGVLLGAWAGQGCPDAFPGTILDIGTGSGLIALMLAQRFPGAQVTGIDIDAAAAAQAAENFAASPWPQRLNSLHISIQDFLCRAEACQSRRFDLIVSNPPFYDTTLTSPDSQRTTARHTATLPYSELMRCSASLLSNKGMLAIVIPAEYWKPIFHEASANGLTLRHLTKVHSTPSSGIRRLLISFGKGEGPTGSDEVLLTGSDGNRSEWHRGLTGDFYLK